MVIGVIVTNIFYSSSTPYDRYHIINISLAGSNTLSVKIAYGCMMHLLTYPGIYTIVTAGVVDAFGPEHYQANFGLLFSQSIVYCATVITLTKFSPNYISFDL